MVLGNLELLIKLTLLNQHGCVSPPVLPLVHEFGLAFTPILIKYEVDSREVVSIVIVHGPQFVVGVKILE